MAISCASTPSKYAYFRSHLYHDSDPCFQRLPGQPALPVRDTSGAGAEAAEDAADEDGEEEGAQSEGTEAPEKDEDQAIDEEVEESEDAE